MTVLESEQTPASTAQASLYSDRPRQKQPGRRKWVHKSKLMVVLYALMFPTIAGMLLFIFYPQFSAIKFSLYTWDGDLQQEYVGFKNFIEAFTQDKLFWQCFQLVGILLMANLVKMWPAIFAAVVLHRIKSDKAQYIYRVLFVIPMIIPGLVMLLMWKSFYDPTIGILNIVLNKTGAMNVLNWLDQVMPPLSKAPGTVMIRDNIVGSIFGGVWGMAIFSVMLLSVRVGLNGLRKGWFWWTMLAAIGFGYWYGGEASQDNPAIGLGLLRWIIAMAIPIGLSAMASDSKQERLLIAARWAGAAVLAVAVVLLLGTMVWTTPIHGFARPAPGVGAAPSWLGNSQLIIPSIIFWGFPWIGTVGVLIYLAGLQGISTDVYEAAELDGVSSLGKLFKIELPLIMTQVRINLIFMTIGTLGDYGLMLLLLGPDGGPGNKGMVPGLYAYRAAFVDQRYGYACALGMVMFVIILFITIIYQKYVKVDK